MKKIIPIVASAMLSMPTAWAQDYSAIIMVGAPSASQMQAAAVDDDELAAYQWFVSQEGARYVSAADMASNPDILTGAKAVWVNLDRETGHGNPADFVASLKGDGDPLFSSSAIDALTRYYKGGGNLLLTNHAGVMLKETGRYGQYPNSLGEFGSGAASDSPEVKRARVSYFTNDGVNDKSADRLFSGLDILADGYKYFNLIGAGMQENHNCYFTLDVPYNGGNYPNDDTAKYDRLKEAYGVEQLAVVPRIGDICSSAITRWLPKDDFKGTAIAIGFGGYEWKQNGKANPYQGNIETLTKNALAELSGVKHGGDTPDPDPQPDPDPVKTYEFAGIAMLGSAASADDDESAARKWFEVNGGTFLAAEDLVSGAASLSGYKAVWVNLDRETGSSTPSDLVAALRGAGDPMMSSKVIETLTAYYKGGGKLLLTNHAGVMLKETGRYGDYPNSLGKFGAGAASSSSEVKRARVSYFTNDEVNDKSADRLFSGLEILAEGYRYFNLIGAGMQENHNCYFTLDVPYKGGNYPNNDTAKYDKLKEAYGVEQLAVVPEINDICSSAITRWLPMDDFDGVALAIGFGGYEWKQNGKANPYQGNIERLTANALYELIDDVGYEHVYSPEPPKPVEDGIMLIHYDMDKVDGMVRETVGGHDFQVRGQFSEVMPGAVNNGTSLRLDAYSSFVEGGAMTDVIINKMTVDFWCAAETYPMGSVDQAAEGWAMIAGNERDGNGWLWDLSSRGNYRFGVSVDGHMSWVEANGTFPKYKWCHLVAEADASTGIVKIYNNGVLVGQGTCPKGTITLGDGSVIIGKSRNSAMHVGCLVNSFNGLVDDLTVYSGVDKVAALNAVAPQNEADLIVSADRYEDNILRPLMHAAPGANWGNETHGLYYDEATQTYHAFYQKNANGHYLSHMHWGHLVSKDLIKWQEVKTAIAPSEPYDWKGCWSGCIIRDDDLNGGIPTIYYTAVDDATPSIVEARPLDADLLDWSKAPTGISRINSGYDFRDPYVFKHDGEFYMIIGCANSGKGAAKLHVYDRATKTWSVTPTVFFEATGEGSVPQGAFWEMPAVIKMGDKWLMSVTTCAVEGADVRAVYWTGKLEGKGSGLKFVPDDKAPRCVELYAGHGYGFLSPSVLEKDGKVITVGIVPDKLPAADNFNNGWSHTYSLPREWSLVDGELAQAPYAGLVAARDVENKVVKRSGEVADRVELPSGRMFEVDLLLNAGATGVYTLEFFKGNDSGATLSLDMASKTLSLDTERLNRVPFDSNVFEKGFSASVAPAASKAKGAAASGPAGDTRLHLFVDHSNIDLFVNDKLASSVRIYPRNTDDTEVTFTKVNDNGGVKSLEAYALTTQNSPTTSMIDVAGEEDAVAMAVRVDGETLSVAGPSDTCSLEVYDLAGRNVWSATIAVDVPFRHGLTPGIYVYKLSSGESDKSGKMIVR